MAVIHDVMPAFLLLQPASLADAQKLLEQQGADAWILAGGLDSFDWLKDRMRKPKAVIDLSGVRELKGVRSTQRVPMAFCIAHSTAALPARAATSPTPFAPTGLPGSGMLTASHCISSGMSRIVGGRF